MPGEALVPEVIQPMNEVQAEAGQRTIGLFSLAVRLGAYGTVEEAKYELGRQFLPGEAVRCKRFTVIPQ